MKQDNIKKVEALHSNTSRGVAELINSKGIQKEDILQVIPIEEGFGLLYYK